MFDSENKENASTDGAPSKSNTRSPRVERRPMQEWNHPSEVSPIARPEVSVSLRGLGASRSLKTCRLRETSSANYSSPLQRLSGMSPNLSMLPRYSTPPSRIKNFVVSNPFDLALKDSLHMPVYSPSLFREVPSPPKNVPKIFSWTIEEISVLNPAPIEDDLLTSQFEEVEDSPETESKTQQMIDSYFSFHHNIESPWLSETEKRKVSVFLKPRDVESAGSPGSPDDASRPAARRSVGCQTVLSLPSTLPPELEEALLPYFGNGEDLVTVEGDDPDEAYLDASACSLRRRLFRDVPATGMVFSPGPCSSPITCGTVLPADSLRPVTTRSYGTPLPGSSLSVSPGISPMRSSPAARSSPARSGPVRRLRRAKSKTRLDFADECCSMSVDVSLATQNMSVELDSPGKDCQQDISTFSPCRRVFASPVKDGSVMDASVMDECARSFDHGFGSTERSNGVETLRGRSRGLFRDESVWEPTSKHIVSSTPAKVSP